MVNMYLHTINNKAYIGVSFDLYLFPEMIKSHGNNFKDTLIMEEKYSKLVDNSVNDFEALSKFIKDVCRWGNYAGVGGKVLKHNSEDKIVSVFRTIVKILSGENPDLALALSHINTLFGLGTPSFASKHLRFILPQVCPVYDSILTDVLPYSFDPAGYASFAADCMLLSEELCSKKIENPIRNEVTWYVSDVEAAIFSQFYD